MFGVMKEAVLAPMAVGAVVLLLSAIQPMVTGEPEQACNFLVYALALVVVLLILAS